MRTKSASSTGGRRHQTLEPRSPYRPWQTDGSLALAGGGRRTDTDPQLVLTAAGVIGPEGDIDHALATIPR